MQTWYCEREDDIVQKAIDMIRVYQYKMPDGIGPYRHYQAPWPRTWWDVFWTRLENVPDRRAVFIRRWLERNQPGGYQTSLSEMFNLDRESHRYFLAGQPPLDTFADGGQSNG